MVYTGTQTVHTLSKLLVVILLEQSRTFGTTANVIDYGINGSFYHCPSFNEIILRWHEFHPFTHYNSSSKALEGTLVNYMKKALNICCPNVQIVQKKVNINSSCEMEIFIRQSAADTPTVHFPIFANRGEKEQFERRFLGLFDSPGPAVLRINHGISSSSNEFIFLLNDLWKLIIVSLLHAVFAGMIIWFLDNKCNPQFPSRSFQGIGNGIWWAFVTLTTVGYGDKSPHSTLARIFAVLWMLEGTVLTALFSARLTADLTAVEISKELNLIGKKVGVPLGMETFLTKEFNFGAQFEELNDFHELDASMDSFPSLDYLIFFDYIMGEKLLKDGHIQNLVIERNIAHKFSVGMILIGDIAANDESFFSCWRRELVDNKEIERAQERCANKEHKEPPETPLGFGIWIIINSAVHVFGFVSYRCLHLGIPQAQNPERCCGHKRFMRYVQLSLKTLSP